MFFLVHDIIILNTHFITTVEAQQQIYAVCHEHSVLFIWRMAIIVNKIFMALRKYL